MNPFSGSTNLWRILREYEPLKVLFGSVRGFLVGLMVSKLARIACNMTFWALFEHFHVKKDIMNPFSGSTCSTCTVVFVGVFWENISP